MTTVLSALVGLALLVLGRKLYWLFVGGIGFVAALGLATRFVGAMPEWLQILVAVVVGLVGALLAILAQKVAIGLAGFVGGGLILALGLEMFGLDLTGLWWLAAFVVGGLIGAFVVSAAFDWALILLSSLAGASLIVEALPLGRLLEIVVYGTAVVAGIVAQAALRRAEKHDP
jgi:hypothetical protein